jgi:SAM-dependent methyltransferase
MSEWGQVNRDAAEVYEELFVPALFEQWAGRVVDAARVRPGQRVLDAACGTGVVARELARRVGDQGRVVGIDRNEGMLAVASRKAPGVDLRHGRVEALPFDAETFDAVCCQFALMFFEDRLAAIHEMLRVSRRGGRVAVAVWASLASSPGFAAEVDLLGRLFGEPAADALRAPFALGDVETLRALFAEAGAPNVQIETHDGTARFPSIRSWMFVDARGWTLADLIDDAGVERLVGEAERELGRFVTADGTVAFPAPAHIAVVTKA